MKKQIRSLFKQMEKLACGNTEKMLDISLIDKDLERLAGILNQYNDKQRLAVSGALQHEERLKESIANISHDLRTPLTVIMGHLQLLKKENIQIEHRKRIETVLNKAERMKELVETFYDLSVLMVERILQNLLTNAIRYSNGKVEIILTQPAKDKIMFSIINFVNNAMDIDVSRLFERFYTADPSRHNGGTGLGLAVVKMLTEKLDGRIEAKLQTDALIVTLEL